MKKYWPIIVFVVVLVVAVVAWVMVDKAAKKKQQETPAPTPANSTTQSSTPGTGETIGSNVVNAAVTNTVNSDYPIKYNKYSSAAKVLQWHLGVTQDGYIGPNSLKEWQKYKSVNTGFTISNKSELDYYCYEISEKKAGRTPLGMQAYFTKNATGSAGSTGTAANNATASTLMNVLTAPLRIFGL